MLFSLLSARKSILLCFIFLFLVILSNFSINLVVKEKIKVKFSVAIPTETQITILKEIIDTPPFVADKTIKILSI